LSTPSKVIALAPRRKKPVQEYLKSQRRFRHLFTPKYKHVLKEIQQVTDKNWEKLLIKCKMV
ncbi:MAG: pyruvate ferredoxin oxidoreductase, partial [Candidatus Thorarchaeota archaeon]